MRIKEENRQDKETEDGEWWGKEREKSVVGKTECMDMDGWVSFSFSWPSLDSLAWTNEQGLCGIDGRRESLRRTVMGSSKDYYYTATRITQEREGKSFQAVEYKLPPPPRVTRTMGYKLNQTLAHDRLLTIVPFPPAREFGCCVSGTNVAGG